jgi:hypothetical protein
LEKIVRNTLIPVAGLLVLVTSAAADLPQTTLPDTLPQVTLPPLPAPRVTWEAPAPGESVWRYDPEGRRWWWYSRDDRCWYRVAESAPVPAPRVYQPSPVSFAPAFGGFGGGGC